MNKTVIVWSTHLWYFSYKFTVNNTINSLNSGRCQEKKNIYIYTKWKILSFLFFLLNATLNVSHIRTYIDITSCITIRNNFVLPCTVNTWIFERYCYFLQRFHYILWLCVPKNMHGIYHMRLCLLLNPLTIHWRWWFNM